MPALPDDYRARLRAALKYGEISRETASRLLDTSPAMLSRYYSEKDTRYTPTVEQLRKVAEAAGLPFEFFTADLSRLAEIVPAGGWMTAPGSDEAGDAAIRRARALAERVARQQPGNPQAEPDTRRDEGERETGA